MKYEKAQDILPKDVLEIIQKYMDGGYLYIPRKSENRKVWGETSGSAKELEARNKEIFGQFNEGKSIKELASMYFLSEASIRRIVRIYRRAASYNEKLVVDN